MEPRIIKGAPGGPHGKWEEVQAIQHEPFIFIQYNGSHWAGDEPDDIARLVFMLEHYKLREGFRGRDCYSKDVCRGVPNPNWTAWDTTQPSFIDGPRLYAANGVYRFHGNFENISHAFGIDTNHEPTIRRLLAAIQVNEALTEDVDVDETIPY